MSKFEDEVCALVRELHEQEERRKAREAAEEAKLTPQERELRRRFERALFGPEPPPLLGEIWFERPEALLVFADAYRAEAHRIAARPAMGYDDATTERLRAERDADAANHERAGMVMVALWLASRGHEMYVNFFKKNALTFPLPPVPRSWRSHWDRVMLAVVPDYEPPPTVVKLDDFRQASV